MEKLIKAYGFRGFLMVFSGFFLFNIIILGGVCGFFGPLCHFPK